MFYLIKIRHVEIFLKTHKKVEIHMTWRTNLSPSFPDFLGTGCNIGVMQTHTCNHSFTEINIGNEGYFVAESNLA